MLHRKLQKSLFASAGLAALIAGMLIVACGGLGSGARINIVLVTLDTTRADRIGAYGYQQAETPTLDRLASEGMLFENAFAQSPMTLPSHASILTGLYPPHHGLRLNGYYRLGDDVPLLPEMLREEGYATGAFISAFVLDSQFGLDRGFDVYDDEFAVSRPKKLERRGDETTTRALAWMESQAREKRPFFLWLHLFDPHLPYAPPEPWAEEFKGREYDGEIAFVDAQVGRVMERLERAGIDGRTLVIVTADHGEGLGEHRERTHALYVYDSTIRVPLIVRPPSEGGEWSGTTQPGGRVTANVETVDIVPTVLEVAGIGTEGSFDGHSLAADAITADRVAYAESWYPLSFGWSPLRAVRREGLKVIRAPRNEAFAFREDRGELEDLLRVSLNTPAGEGAVGAASGHGDACGDLLAWLEEFESQSSAAGSGEVDIDLAALGALGYLGAGPTDAPMHLLDSMPDPKDRIEVYRAINDARGLAEAGEPARAMALLEPLAEHERENPVLLQVLGNAYVAANRLNEGAETLRRYAALAPHDLEAPLLIANVELRRGQPKEAEELLRAHLEQFPEHGEAWDQLAVAHGMAGDLEASLAAGRRAVEHAPQYATGRKNLGVTLLGLGRAKEAEAEFRAAMELEPESEDFRRHLELARERMKQ